MHYTDWSEDNARRARRYFQRAGVASRVRIHVGDAMTARAETPGEYDSVFNDVDKQGIWTFWRQYRYAYAPAARS